MWRKPHLRTRAGDESVSREAWVAGAGVAAVGVSAGGVGVARRRDQALVDVCNQVEHFMLEVRSNFLLHPNENTFLRSATRHACPTLMI